MKTKGRATKAQSMWRSDCPISMSLDIFGDRWTLLVVRDLLLKGRHTFQEFEQGGESIATNVLSDRLAHLEAHGIVVRARDPSDGRRVFYGLTAKGVALGPVLAEMILWAGTHEQTAAPARDLAAIRRDRKSWLRRATEEAIRGRTAGGRT